MLFANGVGQRISVVAALFALTLVGVVVPAPASADGAIVGLMSEQDAQILSEFNVRREAAINVAMNVSDEAASDALQEILAGKTLSFSDSFDPSGDWSCRYIKLGGEPALVIYGWFSCRIFDDGAGWVMQKIDGSQRSKGRLYDLPQERLLYLGALHYTYETPIWFGDDPSRNQMALLTRLDDGRLRLEFPAPLYESDFDILELAP